MTTNNDPTLADYLYQKPTTRKFLSAWVDTFLGFKLHDTVRCSDHQSQLDYVFDAFTGAYSACVYMAARNAGKSYAAAVALLLDCWYKPGIKCAVAAYIRRQSDYIYTYLKQFLDVLASRIGGCKWEIFLNDIKFDNGSSIKFFSGGKSSASIKGYHPSVLVCDEGDLFSQQEFDGIAFALDAGGSYGRRFDVLSTNYRVAGEGVILKQIERYEEYNRNRQPSQKPCRVFRTCLLDILSHCDSRYSCYDEVRQKHCALWSYCKGKAKEAGGGFYPIESALETAATSSRQVFESQLLLLRPTSEFAYFHNFSAANIPEHDRELDPTLITCIAFDFGGSVDPHAACVVQKNPATGAYYVIDEFVSRGLLEGLISKVVARYPNATEFDCFCGQDGNRTTNNEGAVSYSATLKRAGFFPRLKVLKRDPTFELVYNLIDPVDGVIRLFVNKRCKQLLAQLWNAECKVFRGKPLSEAADIKPDDLLDNLRVIVGWTGAPKYVSLRGARRVSWF